MSRTKKTETEILNGLFELKKEIESNPTQTLGSMGYKSGLNNNICKILREGGAINNKGTKFNPYWEWTGVIPNIYTAKRVRGCMDKINMLNLAKSKGEVVETPKWELNLNEAIEEKVDEMVPEPEEKTETKDPVKDFFDTMDKVRQSDFHITISQSKELDVNIFGLQLFKKTKKGPVTEIRMFGLPLYKITKI